MSINMNGQKVIMVKTPYSHELKNLVNVNYIQQNAEQFGSNALKGYPEAIQSLQSEITKLEDQVANLVRLNGSSLLLGDINCPSISGIETPQSSQLTNIANVDYVNQVFKATDDQYLAETPCLIYSQGTLNQTVDESHFLTFDTTKLLYKSSNSDNYFKISPTSISFYKSGVFYLSSLMRNVQASSTTMSVQLVLQEVNSGTKYILSDFFVQSGGLYVISSYFAIQKENIINSSLPLNLCFFVTGGSSSDSVICSEMSWFIFSINLYGTKE